MTKVFHIDKNKCSGCKACLNACKDISNLDAGTDFRKINSSVEGKFPNLKVSFSSISCNNCKNAPCVESCPTGAMNRKNKYKLVLVDEEKCIGCGVCQNVCPYEQPKIDEKKKKSTKCNFCIELLKEGKNPRCVDVCNTRALDFGEKEDLLKKYQQSKFLDGEAKPNLLVTEKER
ncbi:MAG: 4Fe-4S dicluster domain-containing protein [Finegoldia sp.]|nr:4Fe-4S dicluster domain-containing protein [Finegoldia sp.]